MLTKIIGPKPLREARIKQAIYYYGILGCKPLIFEDPDNKACILVGDEDPVYTVNPKPSFAMLDSYFKSRFPTKIKIVEVKASDQDKTLAEIGYLAGRCAIDQQTLQHKQILCARLNYLISLYAYEDMIPDFKLHYENNHNGQEHWLVRHNKSLTDPNAVYYNFRVESFLHDRGIAFNKYPLYGLFATDFILTDIVDFACAMLAMVHPQISQIRLSPQNNDSAPVTWQRSLHQRLGPNPIAKIKLAGLDEPSVLIEKCSPKEHSYKSTLTCYKNT